MKRWMPWIIVGVFALWILSEMRPRKDKDGFAYNEFGRIPILLDGRVQPIDSMARNALLKMSGKSVVRINDGKDKLPPTEWVVEAMTKPDEADKRKIFRLENQELRTLFTNRDGRLGFISFEEIRPKLIEIEQQATNVVATKKEPKLRTGYEKDLVHLFESVLLYHRIKNTLQPESAENFIQELEMFKSSIAPGLEALEKSQTGEDYKKDDLQLFAGFFRRYQGAGRMAYALVVPPDNPSKRRDDWQNVGTALMDSMRNGNIPEAVPYFARMTTAYRANNAPDFNKAVAEYRTWLAGKNFAPELSKAKLEFFFNQVEFFYKPMIVYVVAILFGAMFWLNLSEPIRRAGFYLLVLGFVIHTTGLAMRMYLEGRPPVTNLYSSAVFVGWGSVLLGIILERIYRGAIGIVVAGLIGFVTLIIAHHLSLAGDTMIMLQAVLDTNLWLATHVVIITIGYAAMFVAGILAMIYIVRGFFTKNLNELTARSLARMTYGILCFSTLFSFVGTILGGIWADQSWGRFWGWDPKENGALLIVLWCAVVLHARWGGLVRERGLMVMAIFGNVVTAFSWFGVNLLEIGLHSYGFMDEGAKWLLLFVVSQAVLMAIGLCPLSWWGSFKKSTARPTAGGLEPVPARA